MLPATHGRTAPRRRWLRAIAAGATALAGAPRALGLGRAPAGLTLVTFGDSILDCGRYNAHGVHPGRLLLRNDDALFPAFRGRDLASSGFDARLDHRAVDGARVNDLPGQAKRLRVAGPAIALLAVGGNDLLSGLAAGDAAAVDAFERRLTGFLDALPIRPVLVGNVYDPTFGDDARNFLPVDPRLARRNLARVNAVLAKLASGVGEMVDVHAHFLRGDPSWFTQTIEPSLRGASEVRAAFLPATLRYAEAARRGSTV